MTGIGFQAGSQPGCEADRRSIASKTGFTLSDLALSGDDLGLSSRPQPAVLKMEPCDGTVAAQWRGDDLGAGSDIILVKGMQPPPYVDRRTARQKLDELDGEVKKEMNNIKNGTAPPWLYSSKDVFAAHVYPLETLIADTDKQFAKDWRIYHEQYMKLKPEMAFPVRNLHVFIDDARKLAATLPEDQRKEINAGLDEIAKYPNTGDGTTKYWTDKFPKTPEWQAMRTNLTSVDSGRYSNYGVTEFHDLRAKVLNDVQSMKDLRNYTRPFLEVSGKQEEEARNERQEQLLQATFDTIPTSELLESPTLMLRDLSKDGAPVVEFWNKGY